jgi:arsenite methyltransferase
MSGSSGVFPERAISSTHDTPELAELYEESSVYQFNNGKDLISALNISSGERVLDIGAGTGRLGAYVAKIVGPSGWVVGIDPLPLRIEIAQSKAIGNFEAHVGRAEELSEFADASFDVVYLNSVFQWVEDKPRALAEIFRVLKMSGRLGLNSRDPDHPHELRHFIRRAVAEVGIELHHGTAHPSLDLIDLLGHELEAQVTAAGFVAYASELRTFVDIFPDVDALLTWVSSSTFGNFLVGVSGAGRASVRDALDRLLAPKHISAEGIRLERYLRFATARKQKLD